MGGEEMSAEIVKLHKTPLDEAIDLVRGYGTDRVIFIIKNPETELVEYIAPTDCSIYELAGWCTATVQDILAGDD
jgi:hypothetical protein